MIPTQRTCIIESHKMIQSTHICTFDKCNQANRWICIQCVLKSIHLHGLQSQEHIMDQEQFYQFVSQIKKQKMDYYDSQFKNIQKLLKTSKEIQEIIVIVLQFLQDELNRIKELNHIQLIQQISQLAKQDFQLISNEQISQVVSIKDTLFECNYENCSKNIKQIALLSKDLKNQILLVDKNEIKEKKTYQQQQDKKNQINNQFAGIIIPDEDEIEQFQQQQQIIIPPLNYKQQNKSKNQAIIIPKEDDIIQIQQKSMKEQFQKQPSVIIPPLDYKEENKIDKQIQNRQYETYFERTLKSQISTLEISPDEKYFILGSNDKEIQIFELNVQQIIKTITLNNKAMVIKFTNDSKYIFCGDQGGYLNIYEISNFKEIFNKQLHSSSLNSFKIIDNYQIITFQRQIYHNHQYLTK